MLVLTRSNDIRRVLNLTRVTSLPLGLNPFDPSSINAVKRNKHNITLKPYKPKPLQDHDYKNMELNRPMSPHLTVYALNVSSFISIVQRATGMIVASYAFVFSFGALFFPNGVESFVNIFQSMQLGFFTSFILKLIGGFPFTLHYFNGIRFSLMMTGRLLSKPEIEMSIRKTWIAGAVAAFLFAFL